MKIFDWDERKNEKLKKERGISIEEVILCIQEGKVLAILEHPNPQRYKGQKLVIIEIENYAYVVPYEERGDTIYLKTVFPSRKYTKIYLMRRKGKDGDNG